MKNYLLNTEKYLKKYPSIIAALGLTIATVPVLATYSSSVNSFFYNLFQPDVVVRVNRDEINLSPQLSKMLNAYLDIINNPETEIEKYKFLDTKKLNDEGINMSEDDLEKHQQGLDMYKKMYKQYSPLKQWAKKQKQILDRQSSSSILYDIQNNSDDTLSGLKLYVKNISVIDYEITIVNENGEVVDTLEYDISQGIENDDSMIKDNYFVVSMPDILPRNNHQFKLYGDLGVADIEIKKGNNNIEFQKVNVNEVDETFLIKNYKLLTTIGYLYFIVTFIMILNHIKITRNKST